MRLREDHTSKKTYERPAPKFRNTSAGKPQPVRERSKPEPTKQRPKFTPGRFASPSLPGFSQRVKDRQNALYAARHANDAAMIARQAQGDNTFLGSSIGALRHFWNAPVSDMGMGFGTSQDWKYFSTSGDRREGTSSLVPSHRPGPKDAQKEYDQKVSQSVIPDDEAIAFTARNIQNADAADQAAHDIRQTHGYTGVDIIDVPQFAGKKARDRAKNDPYIKKLTETSPNRFDNTLQANAMGVPLSDKALRTYLADAGDIIAAGVSPEQVPGLVLTPEWQDSINTLKASLLAHGHKQRDIERMNFGQLIALAQQDKLGKPGDILGVPYSHVANKAFQSLPRSGAQFAINFPAGFAAGLRSGIQDVSHGHFSLPATRHIAYKVGAGLAEQGKEIALHPARSFENDPIGTALFLYGVIKGGGSIHGRINQARGKLPENRVVTLGRHKSMIRKYLRGQADSPDMPIVPPPHAPVPEPPSFGKPRGIESPMQGEHTGAPYGRPTPPPTALEAAIREHDARTLARREAPTGIGAPPERPAIGNRATRERELQSLNEAAQRNQRTLDSLYQMLRRNPTGNEIRATLADLEQQKQAALKLIEEEKQYASEMRIPEVKMSVGEVQLQNIQNLIDSVPDMLKAGSRRRKDIHVKIQNMRKVIDETNRNIFNAHVDLGIPHPRRGSELAAAEAALERARRDKAPAADIERLQTRVATLRTLGHEHPLEAIRQSADYPNHDLQGHVDAENPLSPVRIAGNVLHDSFMERSHDLTHSDSANVMDVIQEAIHNIDNPSAAPHHGANIHPDVARMMGEVRRLARAHFGANWEHPIIGLTKQGEGAIRAFTHDLVNAAERIYNTPASGRVHPGRAVERYTGPRYHAKEPTGMPPREPGGEVAVRRESPKFLRAKRDLSQDPPSMTFGDWPKDAQGRLSTARTSLVRARRHGVVTEAAESLGARYRRGTYSRNTVDAFFERLRDRALESEKPVFRRHQRRFMERRYDTMDAHTRRAYYVRRDRELKPLRELAKRLTQHESAAAIQAHIQGVLPSEMKAFYDTLIAHRSKVLQKINFPQELRDELRSGAPRKEVIDDVLKILDQHPEAKPQADWLRKYRSHLENEDYLADPMFRDIITSPWKVSKDLRDAKQMWDDIMDNPELGDHINEHMQAFIDEAKIQAKKSDAELEQAGIFDRNVLENRTLQRQKMVSAVLGKEVPYRDAVYVGDRSNVVPARAHLYTRVRSTDSKRVFGDRAKPWSGSALLSGKLNPGFANFYTGITSARSKVDAIKFQRRVLDEFGVKVQKDWSHYDGSKYRVYDASTGAIAPQIAVRSMMAIMNQGRGEHAGLHIQQFMNEQRILSKSEETPNKPFTPAEQKLIDNGDLYLVPIDLMKKVDQRMTKYSLDSEALRYIAKGTRLFRFVALALRPGYLIVNTAESAFRTGYFGGVSPAGFIRTLRQSREFKDLVTPEWLARSTLSGDVLADTLHLGSKEAKWFAEKKSKWNDDLVRWNRAPLFGNVIDVARWVAHGGPGAPILKGTSRAENYLRESMILTKQLKAAREFRYSKDRAPAFEIARSKYGLPYVKSRAFLRHFKGIDDQMRDLMKDIAADHPKNEVFQGKMDGIVNEVARVLGDFSSRDHQVLSQIFPFWRWMSFITKFVFWESPVHYPGRTLLLQQLGKLGYNDLSQMGVLPPNIQGAIPVSGVHDAEQPDGTVDKTVTVMYTQAWNGMSSVPQMFGVNPATGEMSLGSGLIRNLNPFMQAAITSITLHDVGTQRQLVDKFKNPLVGTGATYLELMAANSLRAFWPLVLDYDYSQMADNSIPILNEVSKVGAKGPYIQPQSDFTQKATAILTGFRTRNIDLTKLQQKNLVDAMDAIKTTYESMGDGSGTETPAQARFTERFNAAYDRQLQYMAAWLNKYVDPSSQKDWRAQAEAIAALNGPG